MTPNRNSTFVIVVLIAVSLVAAMPLWAASPSEPGQQGTTEEARMPVTRRPLDRNRNLVEIPVSPSQIQRISIEASALFYFETLQLFLAVEKMFGEEEESYKKRMLVVPKDESVWLELTRIARFLRDIKQAADKLRPYPLYIIGLEFNTPFQGIQAVFHPADSYEEAKTIHADMRAGAIKTVSVYAEVGSGTDPQSSKPTTWKPCRKCMVAVFGY